MRTVTFALMLAALGLAARPTDAQACGGTFCDNVPMAMPVDQTGENVIFVLEPGQVEVHIQIQYDPDTNAQKFAWMIPLPEVPEFAVGSQLFFQEMLRATVPIYGLNPAPGSCSGGGSFISEKDAGGGGEPDPEEPVDVLVVKTVGAFELVVLAGKSAPEIMKWLGDNGFQQDAKAEPIIQEYLDEGNKIVALKLARNEGIDAIHPIVLRFPGDEGCVPIRLTRIAAVDDMDIRVFVLGDHRAVPSNYKHVEINPLKIDWLNLATNYKEVVSMAVDSCEAGGRAFVTEYAGTTKVVQPGGFYSAYWDPAPFVGLPTTAVVDELNLQGLMSCFDPADCQFRHPLIENLLSTYMPVPDGVPAPDFYACLECFEAMIDKAAWSDGSGFAADLKERVTDPALHARTLIDVWPGVTRMYTTISPHEMTEDPEFITNPDLPGVDNLRFASRLTDCDGNRNITLPDGRSVQVAANEGWPSFQANMPWAEKVEQMPPKGQPQALADNSVKIDDLLTAWKENPDPASTTGAPTCDTSSPMTTGETSAGEPTTGGGTTGGTSGAEGSSGTSEGPPGQGGGDMSACACRNAQERAGALALLGLLGLRRRRRSAR